MQAGMLAAPLLLATPATPLLGADGEAADLSLLRQFHSYAPARLATRATRSDDAAARRVTLMRKARAAWRSGDYARARKLFRQAFKAGDIAAGWYLGYLYRTGRGGKVDHARAFRYYRAVALRYDIDERNLRRLMMSVDALVRVADYYRTGMGGKRNKRDLRRAFRLYSMAAAHNHAGAYYGMALVALASNGRIARKRWAVAWLKRAAMNGHAPAARKLAQLAATGLKGIIRPDPVAARAWRIIAMRLRGPDVARRAARVSKTAALSPQQELQALHLAEQFLGNLQQTRTRATVMTPPPPAAPAPAAIPATEAAATSPVTPR